MNRGDVRTEVLSRPLAVGAGDPWAVKVWVGHFVNRPHARFVVWARSKEEAVRFVEASAGAPDFASVVRVPGPGLVEFHASPVLRLRHGGVLRLDDPGLRARVEDGVDAGANGA